MKMTEKNEEPKMRWYALAPDAALAELHSSPTGIDDVEVVRRRAEHGRNELTAAEEIHPLALFLAQFKSILVGILLAAALIAGATGEWADCIAIGAIVIANAVIGFFQEYGAEKALAALRKLTGRTARVRRGGVARVVAAGDLVPGDVILLESGDVVPADARLLESASLTTNEAALTGESVPVEKNERTIERDEVPLADRQNLVHLGTSIATGSAIAVVFATGMRTEVGGIAGLVSTAGVGEVTPLQRRLASLGRTLVLIVLGMVVLVFAIGALRGLPLLDLFLTTVSLAVAAVPEGLPAVVTIALAVGVQRMARKRALVRKLHAVETLGAATVVCSDKTGTLTTGEMTVRALCVAGRCYDVGGEAYAPVGEIRAAGGSDADLAGIRPLVEVFAGCATASLAFQDGAWTVVGDPTEGALLAVAKKAGVEPADLDKSTPKAGEIPFDSERKRMSVLRRASDGRVRVFVKGAPDVVLARCTSLRDQAGVRPVTDADREAIGVDLAAFADRGLRVLAAAERSLDDVPERLDPEAIERNLVWLGLAGMADPPRPEAKEAVARCHDAGIRVVMITGDHPRTAAAIGRELGILGGAERCMPGSEIDALDDGAFAKATPTVAVFARVTAAHKLRIVRALKAAGEVVAMTGDGVNDAPAIKGADVGVAMGKSGTEVTKEASDIVITDDHFATIVAAIEQGRGVDANVRKTLLYLLAGNLGELLFVTACVVFMLPMPLAPIQLLWINLITDGFPALCLAVDPIDADLMKKKPRRPGAPIVDRSFSRGVLVSGLVTSATAMIVYVVTLRNTDVAMARAHAFSVLVYVELLRSFCFRSETKPLWTIPLASNLRLVAVVVIAVVVQFIAPHFRPLGDLLRVPPMEMSHCVTLFAVAALAAVGIELGKLATRMRRVQ